MSRMQPGIAPGSPQVPGMVATLPPGVALGTALLLATGTATRLAALGLLLFPLGQIGDAGDLRLPWALLLAIPRGHDNARVLLGQVTGVDPTRKAVLLDRGRIPCDYLLLAIGAQHSYLGYDDWASTGRAPHPG